MFVVLHSRAAPCGLDGVRRPGAHDAAALPAAKRRTAQADFLASRGMGVSPGEESLATQLRPVRRGAAVPRPDSHQRGLRGGRGCETKTVNRARQKCPAWQAGVVTHASARCADPADSRTHESPPPRSIPAAPTGFVTQDQPGSARKNVSRSPPTVRQPPLRRRAGTLPSLHLPEPAMIIRDPAPGPRRPAPWSGRARFRRADICGDLFGNFGQRGGQPVQL